MTAEHVLPNWLGNIGLTSQPVTGGAASRCRLVANVPPCREALRVHREATVRWWPGRRVVASTGHLAFGGHPIAERCPALRASHRAAGLWVGVGAPHQGPRLPLSGARWPSLRFGRCSAIGWTPDPVPARYEPAGCGGCGVSGVASVARRTLREGSEDLPVTLLLQVKSAPSPRPALRVTARYCRPQGFKSRP